MTDILRYETRGTLLYISEYPLHHYHQIRSVFTYNRIGFDRKRNRKTFTPETMATGYDADGHTTSLGLNDLPMQIASFRGYEQKLLTKCRDLGVQVRVRRTPVTDETKFIPQWENVPEGFEWRYMQKEAVELMASKPGGIIVAPPGFGKTVIAGILPRIFPKARLLMCTYRKTVLATIAEQARHFRLPGTKYYIKTDTKRPTAQAVTAARVVICTTGSLPKLLEYGVDYDIVLIDEAHNAAADVAFEVVSSFSKSRVFGFTGSPNRSDGGEFRLLGLCGPRLLTVDMTKAVEKGIVVQIKVLWCPVNLQYDPTLNCHAVYKKHRGIWFNDLRNRLVAGAARQYDEDTQVLILVDTVKHGKALRELLPEYTLASSDNIRLDAIRGAFKKGTLKKVIATGVFKEGVDFKALEVLINAAGVKSEIANIQLTGRVSRTNDGKSIGIVHDFYDHWSPEFAAFSRSRKELYEKQGYQQENILPTTLLQHLNSE